MKVNEIITQKFIEALKRGVAPWHKPWHVGGFRNAVSKKPYRGVNVVMLSLFGKGEFYLTFKQAVSLGGRVKKGVKGIPITFYTLFDSKEKDRTGKFKKIPVLRYFTVFPVEDCEGLNWKAPEKKVLEFQPIELCEKIVGAQNAIINHRGNRACYHPSNHEIDMPMRESFVSVPHYYATLFHELTHREAKEVGEPLDPSVFGSDPYAKEELVAEIGAAFLVNFAGIHNENLWENSAAYLQSWTEKLSENPQLILSAASKAQKRFDSMLKKAGMGEQPENSEIVKVEEE